MAEQTNLVQEGVDRLNGAFESIDGEIQRVQRELSARRRSIEKRLSSQRKSVEKRTRKEVKRLQSEFRKNPLVKRAESLRKDATKQIESGLDEFLGLFQIASKSDMNRLDRKLTTLSRRLKELEKARKANGATIPS